VLLDFPAPRIRAYPVYTVVAEKLEAIVSIRVGNTRMKDFHDLLFLSRRFDFDGALLHRAIAATFARRGTSLEGELYPFTPAYINDAERQKLWSAFLARNALKTVPEKFPAVMSALHDFVSPVLQPNTLQWHAGAGWNHR